MQSSPRLQNIEIAQSRRGRGMRDDAAWRYEDPYIEHWDLKDRIAFYEEKYPQLRISG